MNKITITLIFGFICLSCNTNNGIKKVDDIGLETFNIIKNLQSTSEEEFINSFVTIEEVREIAQDDNYQLTERTKNQITSVTKEDYYDTLKKSYQKIKKDAVNKGIILSEIVYVDFIYETDNYGGLNLIEGKLYFKHGEEMYEIETQAIERTDDYIISEIEDLRKKY